jgi:hypothetical protein
VRNAPDKVDSALSPALLVFLAVLQVSLAVFIAAGDLGRPLTHDEALSVLIAKQDFDGIVTTLKEESPPPLYFFLLSLWMKVFGRGEVAVHALSAIFYLAGIAAVYALSLAAYRERIAARMSSFLYMTSGLAISHAHNARMYSLLGLIGILSLLFFIRLFYFSSRSKAVFALWIVFNTLGVFTHYWFAFVLIGEFLSWLLVCRARSLEKYLSGMFLSVLPFVLLWLPIFVVQIRNNPTAWLGQIGVTDWIPRFAKAVLGFFGNGLHGVLACGGIIIILLLDRWYREKRFVLLPLLREIFSDRLNLIFLICALSCLVFPIGVSRIKPMYHVRYTIVALAPFVLFVAGMLRKCRKRALLLVVCLVLAAPWARGFMERTPAAGRNTDRASIAYVVARADPDDILVFTSLSGCASYYYLERLAPHWEPRMLVYPAESRVHPGWINVKRLRQRPRELGREAARDVDTLLDWVSDRPGRLWVFYGSDEEITIHLKKGIEKFFILKQQIDMKGFFYNTVLVYERNSSEIGEDAGRGCSRAGTRKD